MTYWSVDDGNGTAVAQGMSAEHRARELARQHANKTGMACLLYNSDGDEERVEPDNVVRGIVYDAGNGFPADGDYVPHDGKLYRLLAVDSAILCTTRGNYVHARAVPAEWSDCPEGGEHASSFEPKR